MEPEDRAASDRGAAGACPFTIDRPVMRQRWEQLTFLHWPFDAAAVQRLLPGGLRAETFDGAAWVGLVPFYMRVGTAGGHQAPWVSNFCETNVRTYVRDEAGRSGIWFMSLDAARLGAVTVARSTYQLPYYWSSMRLSARDGDVGYVCRRLLPGPVPAASRVRVSIGAPFATGELTARDHFLTARWILFSASGPGAAPSRHRLARASHQPWPLYRAEVRVLDDELVTAAGLPRPAGEPLVHYSPGVTSGSGGRRQPARGSRSQPRRPPDRAAMLTLFPSGAASPVPARWYLPRVPARPGDAAGGPAAPGPGGS